MIEKVAAVVLRGGLLLLCRKRGTDVYISPGGKRDAGESDLDALARELREETRLHLTSARLLGRYVAASALEPSLEVAVDVFVAETMGVAQPAHEIEEIAWIDGGYASHGIKVGSVFRDYVIPRLIADGLMRPGVGGMPSEQLDGGKVIVADLDGTLALSKAGIHPSVRTALTDLAKRDGVRVMIATSRAPRGVRELLGQLADEVDLLCCNGGLHVKGDEVHFRVAIPANDVAAALEALRCAKVDFWLDYGDRFVVSSESAAPWMAYPDREVLDELTPPCMDEVVKMCVIGADQWADPIRQVLSSRSAICVHEDGSFDVTAADASKDQALLRSLDGSRPFIVAFGNDFNDQTILAIANRSFLVGSRAIGLQFAGHVTRLSADDAIIEGRLRAELDASASVGCLT